MPHFYAAPAPSLPRAINHGPRERHARSTLQNHLLFFLFFVTAFLPFLAVLGVDFFAAFFVAVFFRAFGPMPTQLSTVSTTSLILLFFFAIYHSLNGVREHYICCLCWRLLVVD